MGSVISSAKPRQDGENSWKRHKETVEEGLGSRCEEYLQYRSTTDVVWYLWCPRHGYIQKTDEPNKAML
jgi:hypothetical protein